jgi:hypothetical protein
MMVKVRMALKCYTTVHDTRRLDRDHCTATWCASKQASLKRVMTRVPACECSLRGSNTISRYESRQLRMVSMIRDNLLPHVSSCTALYKVFVQPEYQIVQVWRAGF